MEKIILVCSTGASTSILKDKMEEVVLAKGLEVEIYVSSVAGLEEKVEEVEPSILLLAPQILYLVDDYKAKYAKDLKVLAMDMFAFFDLDAEKILNQALN